MTKDEIYNALKADGAKLTKAARFMTKEVLVSMYEDRFGKSPDETSAEKSENAAADEDMRESAENHALSQSVSDNVDKVKILRFSDSFWCPVLGRSYKRGLYRPANHSEYIALKPFAEKDQ